MGRREDKRDAVDAGFDAHLTKPVEIETSRQLFATIEPGTALRPDTS